MELTDIELKELIDKVNDILSKYKDITAEYAMNQVGYKKTKFNIMIKGKYKYNRNDRQYEAIGEPQEEVKMERNIIAPVERKVPTQGIILTIEQQEELLKLLEDNKNNKVDLKIEIPLETIQNYKTTVRVNNVVWERFNKYCKRKKYYSQKDHIARALLSYMKNTK